MRPLRNLGLTVVLTIICLAWTTAGAGEVTVRARADRTRIAAGESLRLSVTIQGGPGEVDLSGLDDFDVVSKGSSTNIQVINGRFSKEIRYDYTLVPKKTGQLTIPALGVETDEGVIKTRPIAIHVTDTPQKGDDRADIFVQAEVSNPKPFAGQQLIYRFRFFNAVQVADGARFQQPDFTGFSVKKVEKEKVFQKEIKGRTYQVTELSFVLIPLESGDITIDPSVLQCQVFAKSTRRDPLSRFSPFFDDRFFARHQAITRTFRTPPVPIRVRPLPPVPADMNFSGLVGQFQVKATSDRREVKAGESVTLTVGISGQGNLMDAPAPDLKALSKAKVYADKPEETLTVTDQGISGEKRFRFAVVPVAPGALELPGIDLDYFDPGSGSYRRSSSGPLALEIVPGEQGRSAPPPPPPSRQGLAPVQKKAVTFSGRDILPLKEEMDALEDRPPLSFPVFAAAMTAPMVIYLLLWIGLSVWKRPRDQGRVMAQKARKCVRRAASVPDLSDAEFLSEIYAALAAGISCASGDQSASLTPDDARRILTANGRKTEAVHGVTDLLQRLETARFGGGHLEESGRRALLEEAKKWIRELCR